MSLVVKNPAANARDVQDVGWIPPSGRPPAGERGSPLQRSCLERLMHRGADGLWSIGSQSRTRLKLLVTHTWLKCCWLGASAGGRAHRQLAAREGAPHRLASAPFSASSGPCGPRFNSGPGLWATPTLTGPCAYLLIQC